MPEATSTGRLDELHLWFLGQPSVPRLVGALRLQIYGKGVSLQYAADWLATGFPLSEDLPLVDIEYLPRANGMAAGAVDDARPDRWGERVIQFIDRPKRLSLMEYLYYAGDDRFGALGVSTSATEYTPRRVGPLPRLRDAQELSEIMRKITFREPINDVERRMASAGGSFGGAKPKALINIDGAEWVIKFFNNEPTDVPLIEHASMTLAARAGITVAKTQVIALAGEHAVAVKRFDRGPNSRLHCISAGTALRALVGPNVTPDLGYPGLAQLLRRSGDTTGGLNRLQMRELFRRMVFNILLDNTDDHEKNHSLIQLGHGAAARWSLAPAYDVLPTNSGQGQQQFLVGVDGAQSTLANAMSQSAQFGLSDLDAGNDILQVIAVIDQWREHFKACGVSGVDIESLAERIDGDELLLQRRNFSLDALPVRTVQRRRRPFT